MPSDDDSSSTPEEPSEEDESSTPSTSDDSMSDEARNSQLTYLLGASAMSCVALVACIIKEKNKQMDNEGGSKEMRKLYKKNVKKDVTMKENLV